MTDDVQQIQDEVTQRHEDLERLLGQKVLLRTWVKVKEGWSDDERVLRQMGYEDP